jgi:hypothetical protein
MWKYIALSDFVWNKGWGKVTGRLSVLRKIGYQGYYGGSMPFCKERTPFQQQATTNGTQCGSG